MMAMMMMMVAVMMIEMMMMMIAAIILSRSPTVISNGSLLLSLCSSVQSMPIPKLYIVIVPAITGAFQCKVDFAFDVNALVGIVHCILTRVVQCTTSATGTYLHCCRSGANYNVPVVQSVAM